MGNDERQVSEDRDDACAATAPARSFDAADREAVTQDLDAGSALDLEDDRDLALLRAVAYAPPRRPPSTVLPGTKWSESGRYVIERRLGRGGMGTVYAATDTVLNRIVALKVLDVAGADGDAAHRAGLLREAQLAARVEHDRIARVYDVGSHEGFAFVAMEYVQGGTLRQRMVREDVPLAQIVDIVTQIAEGLAELHAKGVVHRDLKPENVMLTTQGGVKLVDFGLARHTVLHAGEPNAPMRSSRPSDSTSTAAASGTPGYMSPEQCTGRLIDARSDIFALGVILYELITREKPFRGATVSAIVTATLEDVLVLRDGPWARVPARLRDHNARMLEREPDARFEHGSSVLAALRELAVGLPSHTTPLPAATAQAIGGAPTQRAVRLRPPVFVDVGLATRGLEIPAAVTAFVILAVQCFQPEPVQPVAPSGMALIDVGTINVGRNAYELERECKAIGPFCERADLYREVPRVETTVRPFFLDRDEVTNAELVEMLNTYRGMLNVFDDEERHFPRFVRQNAGAGDAPILDLSPRYGGIEFDARKLFVVRPGHDRLPAVQMTWYAARLYCAMKGKRLPTENEWEAAARGRDERRFAWGDALPRCGEVAIPLDLWIPGVAACSLPKVAHAVGSMVQDVTLEGVHDLGGNVAEWTASLFVEGNRAAPTASVPSDAPRVIRGGSWNSSMMARTSGRTGVPPAVMGPNLGFRCASDAR